MDEVTTQARGKKAQLYQRAETAMARIQDLKAKSARAFYELGRALVAFRDDGLYVAYGYRSWTKFLQETDVLGIQRTLVAKLIAVASHLSRERAIDLGQEKAYVLATYVKAVGDADLASNEDLFGDRVVSKMSTRELQREVKQAVRQLQPPKLRIARSRAAQATGKSDAALIRQVDKRMRAIGTKPVSVTIVDGIVTIRVGRAEATRFAEG